VSQKPSYPVGSAGNVLILLRLLCERGELRVSDAAEHLGVGASTAHRLLAM
jgi:DNA-binding IclR family transcriptional regulator